MNTTDDIAVMDEIMVRIESRSVAERRVVAYVIKTPLAGEFEVFSMPPDELHRTAIWEDKTIIQRLIDAAQSGLPTITMYTYAGMNKDQYFRFRQAHPHWDEYLERCRQKQMVEFMNVLNTDGVKDLTTMRWFMEHKHPDFGKKAEREVDAPLQPTVNIAIGANVDAGIVQATIREIAREVFGNRRKDTRGDEERTPAVMAGDGQE